MTTTSQTRVLETLSETRCFGGRMGFYRHASEVNDCDMRFGVRAKLASGKASVFLCSHIVAANAVNDGVEGFILTDQGADDRCPSVLGALD